MGIALAKATVTAPAVHYFQDAKTFTIEVPIGVEKIKVGDGCKRKMIRPKRRIIFETLRLNLFLFREIHFYFFVQLIANWNNWQA